MTKNDIRNLHEIHPWHSRYIRLTDDLSPVQALEYHGSVVMARYIKTMQQVGDRTYAPEKWTVKEILQHLIDTERILSARALFIARNEQADMLNYDEAEYGKYVRVSNRTIEDLLDELNLARQSTIRLFNSFNNVVLKKVGSAAGKKVSVLAIAYILAGHLLHHLQILRTNYFPILLSGVTIAVNAPQHLPAFDSLNRAWIEKDFELEDADRYLLGNPQEAILDKGGVILYAVENGLAIGTAALQPIEDGEWKLIKMTVDEAHRGRGIGELLTKASLQEAKKLGITSLTLFSNTNFNTAAIRLYRRMGFREVPLTNVKFKRANIKMQINLTI